MREYVKGLSLAYPMKRVKYEGWNINENKSSSLGAKHQDVDTHLLMFDDRHV